ncbi:MAG: clan AA aspartic protease (TIGR02281 family) [Paraglaciecola sp.]|jgi:clan AA aspartic protease (TIGR02281 family)
MKLTAFLIAIIMVISLATNVYLFTELQEIEEKKAYFSINNSSAIIHPTAETTQVEFASADTSEAAPLGYGSRRVVTDKENYQSRLSALQHASGMLSRGEFGQLGLFLQNYLKQHPRDIDFLLLEADLIAQTSLLSDAITHYYSLLQLPLEASLYKQIQGKIEGLAANTIGQLQKSYSWDILAVFVEPLLQVDPTNRMFILALASAYAQQQQENLMENTLAALPFDDPDALAIRDLLPTPYPQPEPQNDIDEPQFADNSEPSGDNAISLEQLGDQYLVSALLSSNKVKLLIDTGASTTAVSEEYFENLSSRVKRNFIGKFKISTANGTVLAPMYRFAQLQISHAQVQDITVVVLNMGSLRSADGLLGMNFLREFDFRIDQINAKLYLKQP